jgi:CubicO group peptidase (beta-lactamase class C family)
MLRKSLSGLGVSAILMTTLAVTGCKDDKLSLTGYVASMTCSKYFVSGLSRDEIIAQDLSLITNGSSNNAKPEIDDVNQRVTSSFLGTTSSAQYKPGLGCVVQPDEIAISADLNTLPEVASLSLSNEIQWPAGSAEVPQDTTFHQLQELAAPLFTEYKDYQVSSYGVAIVKDGKLVYERYRQGIDQFTPTYGFSIGKTLLTLFIGKLVDSHGFDVHAPLGLDQWQGDDRQNITAHHLLTMTSGLAFDESYEAATSDANMLFVSNDMAGLSADKPLNFQPGSHFRYSTANSLIMAKVLNDELSGVAGTYLEYQNFMRALGVNTSAIQSDASGALTFGMKNLMSLRDMARIGQFMLQNGQWNGEQYLPENWMAYMTQPVDSTMADVNKLKKAYGAGVWLNQSEIFGKLLPGLPEDTFLALGMRGQYIIVVPSQQLVIVRTGNTMDLDTFDYLNEINIFASQVAAVL